jgi:tetratricopeptide (TPR) repeat protein
MRQPKNKSGSTSVSLSDLTNGLKLEKSWSRLRWWVGGGVALLVVAGCLFIYRDYQKANLGDALQAGIVAVQRGNGKEALPLLEKSVENGKVDEELQLVARIYLADVYVRDRKFDDAKKILEKNSSYSFSLSSSDYLRQMLLLRIGRVAEEEKDLSEAQKSYQEAADIDGPFAGEALLALASVNQDKGDLTAASEARKKFLSNFPNSPFVGVVQETVK